MRVLAFNAGHDGSAALVVDQSLAFCLEAEKDGGSRHAITPPDMFVQALNLADIPDVVAISGWHASSHDLIGRTRAGYLGVERSSEQEAKFSLAGHSVRLFHSSHERSHIMCAIGMSAFPQDEPCHALVWEGAIGAFYHVDSSVGVRKIADVLHEPGSKYAFLYALADPAIPMFPTWIRMEDAGKLMALAAYGRTSGLGAEDSAVIEAILSMPPIYGDSPCRAHKVKLKDSRICNAGVRSQLFKDAARHLSDAIFDRFHSFAKDNLERGLPLLIAGGCGLNCEWNSRWADCGLFSDVFVPPCTNDSGVALGAAVDAQHYYSGKAKIQWTPYAGEAFVDDLGESLGLPARSLDLAEVSELLAGGAVLAWVQGRYEMGPRALGNRSLLAAPFKEEARDRLNHIKQREEFRPIAPICLQEDFHRYFGSSRSASPHMLYFQKVLVRELAAVTHADGSARAQTVTMDENAPMHAVLSRFKQLTGYGVLCNTSLNFRGKGFINRMSDLVSYARERELDGFVVGDRFYRLK